MIETFDAAEFRRTLAGLADPHQSDRSPENLRDMASGIVLLLAICYNRDQLDAKSLWSRIDGAIQKGLADCDDSIDTFLSVALEHVLADANRVATDDKASEIMSKALGLDSGSQVALLLYLSRHRYTAVALGRNRWNEHKERRS